MLPTNEDEAPQQLDENENEPTSSFHRNNDLPDNAHDAERLKAEEVIIDLPDVKDIPGQEHIHVPRIKEMEDTTISSDDEEGVGLFEEDTDEDDDLILDDASDVSDTEKAVLEQSANASDTGDDEGIKAAALVDMDDDGELLNEASMGTDVTGSDIDTAVDEEDDQMEDIGEEDEENNNYSVGGDNNDDVKEGTV